MTDKPRPTPDDRELEQYLQGGSELSRRYRAASGETPPPELDEAILAQARSELRRRPPGINRWLAPAALAASVMLGINLGWNVYQAAPQPGETLQLKDAAPAAEPTPPQAIAPAAPPPAAPEAQPERRADRPASRFVPDAPVEGDLAGTGDIAPAEQRTAQAGTEHEAEAVARHGQQKEQVRQQAQAQERQRAMEKQAAAPLRHEAPAAASADAAAPAPAAPAPMTEAEKIDRLILYVAGLDDVAFVRNGKVHSAADAAKHMRLKLDKAGSRVRTAEDFIRLCASFSSTTGAAYLMRFPDGRTRTAEDVLREQLATMP